MPPIPFNDVPANLRINGSFVEFDNRLANNASPNFKVLVIGQRLAAGTVAEAIATSANTPDQAEEYFGRGSMLAEQVKKLKNAEKFMEVDAIALDEAVAGVAATGNITATGTATSAGTLAIYIAGERVLVGVAAADTAAEIAIAIAAAITADTTLPVNAVVDGVTTNQVNLTCKWKGETGNDIDLRMNYYEEKTPKGTVMTFVAMAGGTTNPDITAVFAAIGDEWYNWIVMPFTDAANLAVLDAELDARWGPTRQIGARAFAAFRGTHSAVGTFGNGRNNPHVTCMGTNMSPQPPYIWASVNAIIAAKNLAIDPARPLQTLKLTGIMAPAKEVRWDDTERNQLLFDGIATYIVTSDGSVQIERQISTYQLNALGFADDSYLDINTPETLERVRYEQRSMFASKYPRHKLAEDTERVAEGQPIMQPKLAVSELLVLYKDMQDKGWVQDYEGYKATLFAEIGDGIGSGDRARLNWYGSPKIIGQHRVTAGHIEFRR